MALLSRGLCKSCGAVGAMIVALPLLVGCETIAITALGVGASAGVSHTAGGVSYRTFTAPAPQVRMASLAALDRMGIKVDSIQQKDGTEVIMSRYAERDIEITLEPMSKSTTQVRASAKRSLFVYDNATAKEILEQTALSMQFLSDRKAKVASLSSDAAQR